jgi:hypothetical protein
MIGREVVNDSRVVLLVGRFSDLKHRNAMLGHGGHGGGHVLGLYLERKQQSNWNGSIVSAYCSIGLRRSDELKPSGY